MSSDNIWHMEFVPAHAISCFFLKLMILWTKINCSFLKLFISGILSQRWKADQPCSYPKLISAWSLSFFPEWPGLVLLQHPSESAAESSDSDPHQTLWGGQHHWDAGHEGCSSVNLSSALSANLAGGQTASKYWVALRAGSYRAPFPSPGTPGFSTNVLPVGGGKF